MTDRPSQQEHGPMPVVVWDGLGLSSPHSGIGVHGRCLFEALGDLGCTPHVAAIHGDMPTFVPEGHQLEVKGSENKWLSKIERLKPFYPLATYNVCRQTWPDTRVIFHGLSNLNLPVVLSKRNNDRFVVTIHDIIPLNLEEITPLTLQFWTLLPRVVARADRIITASYWTKIQLLEQFGAGISEKVFSLGNGTVAPRLEGKQWTSRTIDGLAIARGETYKRLEILVFLANALPDRKFLLVTDSRGLKRIGNPPKNLEVVTNMSSEGLEEIYTNAKVFVHPSLYEGWCLPAADALARGLPLLYCRGSGIDEVAAFNKKLSKGLSREASVDDWISAFESLVAKEALKHDLAKPPSWLEIAQKTLKIYESLL